MGCRKFKLVVRFGGHPHVAGVVLDVSLFFLECLKCAFNFNYLVFYMCQITFIV